MQVNQSSTPAQLEKPVLAKKSEKAETSPTEKKEKVSEKSTAEVKDAKKPEENNGYLKVLSRVEGMIKEGNSNEKVIRNFVTAIALRLNDVPEPERKAIFTMPEAQAIGVKSTEDLAKKITEGLQKEDKKDVLAFLKNPKFAKLMDSSSAPAETYNKEGKITATIM